MDNIQKVKYKDIFKFWLPLASTWLMMAFEGPYLASIIARLPQEKFNLAAYGVALAIGLLAEAPIIMLMSASTAMVKGKHSYYDLRRFAIYLNILLTLIISIICIPQIFYFFAQDVLGLKSEVSKIAHIATILLIP
jgi:Na+-driven multidrug efflux pump